MLNKAILLLLFMCLGFYGCSKSHFPTMEEAGSLIEKYTNESDESRKIDIIKGLLTRLANPQNASEDNVVRSTMKELAEIYRKNHDETILIAVDETDIDGGFANFVCEFYRAIRSEEQFKKRYQQSPESLERCVGISFSEDDIKNL